MLKYGKRKQPLLPSFSTLRDSSATSRMKSSKLRASKLERPQVGEPTSSRHDNSVDEMASMLLDDTTTMSDAPERVAVAQEDKNLPQLPELLFNGDDAWAQKARPVVTAAGEVNQIPFVESDTANDFSSAMFGDSADLLTPPIPRRSSKRSSIHPYVAKASRSPIDSLEHQQIPSSTIVGSSQYPHQAALINAKIAAMQAASKALKPDAEVLPASSSTKKRSIFGNKVVVKMRTALNGRLSSRSLKKRPDSISADRLLDASFHEPTDEDEPGLSHSVSLIDIRWNEGKNLERDKCHQMTGHGNIARKPVADDGRSIRSRKSTSTDPFYDNPLHDRPGSNGQMRPPFELTLNDMPYDPNNNPSIDLPPLRRQSSRESMLRGKKLKGSPLSSEFETDSFDAMFSSSPFAQSTPRIRLEPTFEENGRKTLKNVPADSRSLFDQDASSIVDIDSPPANLEVIETTGSVKRKNSQLRDSVVDYRYDPKRTKKHPSPNDLRDEHLMDVEKSISSQALASKDPNPKVKSSSKPKEKRRSMGLFPRSELTRSSATMPDIARKSKYPKSMIPKPADKATTRPREENRLSFRDDSAMEIDEFQRNDSIFRISSKRT